SHRATGRLQKNTITPRTERLVVNGFVFIALSGRIQIEHLSGLQKPVWQRRQIAASFWTWRKFVPWIVRRKPNTNTLAPVYPNGVLVHRPFRGSKTLYLVMCCQPRCLRD